MSRRTETRWIVSFLSGLSPTFREVAVMSLFVNILALAVPVFVMQVYDRVVFHAGLSTLQALSLGMVVVLTLDFVLRQTRARVLQTVALRVDVGLGRRLFEGLTALPLRTLERKPAAFWQALFRDADLVRNTVSGAAALLLCDLPFTLLFFGLAAALAPPLIGVFSAILVLFVVIAWRSGHVLTVATDAERQSALLRDTLIAELTAGRATVKALSLKSALKPIWENAHADAIERATRRGGAADSYANAAVTLTLLATVAITAVGAYAVIGQMLSIGALIAANMLIGRLLGPINQMVGQWRTYAACRQAIRRLDDVLAQPTEGGHSAVNLDRPHGRLALETVSFSYGDSARPTIDGVSAAFAPGEMIALVGPNGGGKTTLLKLMQGLYPPTVGRVLLDGADIAQFGRRELARWVGYVPQEVVLFAGSLRDNITGRLPDADDDAILRAARLAGAHSFVLDLPEGYATDVGEAGHRLSAGQRQRVAIARAVLGDPPVLLLDEPTSDLDRQAELDLRTALSELAASRTIVVVTHSPLLLASCRSIVVVEAGRISTSGPADQVLRHVGSPSPSAPTARRDPRRAVTLEPGGVTAAADQDPFEGRTEVRV